MHMVSCRNMTFTQLGCLLYRTLRSCIPVRPGASPRKIGVITSRQSQGPLLWVGNSSENHNAKGLNADVVHARVCMIRLQFYGRATGGECPDVAIALGVLVVRRKIKTEHQESPWASTHQPPPVHWRGRSKSYRDERSRVRSDRTQRSRVKSRWRGRNCLTIAHHHRPQLTSVHTLSLARVRGLFRSWRPIKFPVSTFSVKTTSFL